VIAAQDKESRDTAVGRQGCGGHRQQPGHRARPRPPVRPRGGTGVVINDARSADEAHDVRT
jgi:hypothetical protein